MVHVLKSSILYETIKRAQTEKNIAPFIGEGSTVKCENDG